MKKLLAICLIGLMAPTSFAVAQDKDKDKDKTKTKTKVKTKTPAEPAATAPANDGFKSTPNNLEYKIIRDVEGGKTPAVGDYLELHIKVGVNKTSIGDSTLYDSRAVYDNKPVPYQMAGPAFKGDLPEGLMLLTAGDSALFRMIVDSIPMGGGEKPSWFKPGINQKTLYTVTLVSVKSQEQKKKDDEAQAAVQKETDDKLIQNYLAKNNIKATKTASGLYYVISKPGTGENATAGKKVTVNYTGKTMDGKPFDSNVDTNFHHVQPFDFMLGQGQVIKGWDEGVALLNKGGKATFFIPSGLAYGVNGAGAAIGPNQVLMFDVEVKDIQSPEDIAKKQQATDDKIIKDYLAKNKIKATKTASGLYYVISKPGTGENAKAGQQVTVNYTGKTLDGKPFDSNVDSNFHHVEPFAFQLGQGGVIKGWDEGVALLKKGGKATLYIPSALAYGAQGAGGAIQPNEILMFDVEIVDIADQAKN